MCQNYIFQNFKDVVIVKNFKYSKMLLQIGRNCPKCQFLGQIGHFLLKNGWKKGQNILFSEL